jgi:hypothetical protein
MGRGERCAMAAWGGRLRLDVLKWAREHNCPWDEDTLRVRSQGWAPGDASMGAERRHLWDENNVV